MDVMQFGFISGKETIDTIFVIWQMQEKFTVKGQKLYFDLWIKKNTWYGTKKSDKIDNTYLAFTARCYASAVLAMALCPSLCLSVCHKSVCY